MSYWITVVSLFVIAYLGCGVSVFIVGEEKFQFEWSPKVFVQIVLFWPVYLKELLK